MEVADAFIAAHEVFRMKCALMDDVATEAGWTSHKGYDYCPSCKPDFKGE